MEFIKKSDIYKIIDERMNEPVYQHIGEDFYNGICAVGCDLERLPVYDVDMTDCVCLVKSR